MNTRNMVVIAVVAGLAALLAFGSPAVSQGGPAQNFAFVDVARLFQDLPQAARINQDARAEILKINQDLEQRAAEIRRMEEDLELLVPGTPEFSDLKRTIDFKKFEFDYDQDRRKQEVMSRAVKKMNLIYTEIRNTCENYARQRGLQAIFMYNDQEIEARSIDELRVLIASRPVIFRDQGLDVTDPVLELLRKN